MDSRARDIFRIVVDYFLETNSPVGSDMVVSRLEGRLSSATVRHVMSALQAEGLFYSPHCSSGRLPTDLGLRLFVEGILEVKPLDRAIVSHIERTLEKEADKKRIDGVLEDAGDVVSALSHSAALVMVPKQDVTIKHIEFVPLQDDRVLVVVVAHDDTVENRLIRVPSGYRRSSLIEAGNYLNARLCGYTLHEGLKKIEREIKEQRSQLHALAQHVITLGFATWSGDGSNRLIIRGQAALIDDIHVTSDIEKIRHLISALESGENFRTLLRLAAHEDGVKIFIGAHHPLFNHAGCSLVVSPIHSTEEESIVGAVGIVGPSRMNYGRMIGIVEYTAQFVSQLIDKRLRKSL